MKNEENRYEEVNQIPDMHDYDFCCPDCGSTRVWEKIWHETNEPWPWSMGRTHPLDGNKFYCPDCEQEFDTVRTVEEFRGLNLDSEKE
jgi:predicted RNA-binding Zn-ribbon protein involved in translation (DUF1610 family)